jgi:hypothetical protein
MMVGMYPTRIRELLLTLLLSSVVALGAAETPHASKMFNTPDLLRDLQVLSSDDMEGRRVATPGSEKAQRFIVDRFRASGLRPLGDSYLHPFMYTHSRREVRQLGPRLFAA